MGGAKKINWPIADLDLSTEYGMSNLKVKGDYRSVLRVGNDSNDYALKCVELDHRNLVFLLEVLDFLKSKGFRNYPDIIPTIRGQRLFCGKSGTYQLIEWIHGRESNFSDVYDLITYAKTLGKLHRLTKGFRPNGNVWKDLWSAKLQVLVTLKLTVDYPNRLDKLIPAIIKAGEKAVSLTQQPEVLKSLGEPAVICHHDLTSRNFIIGPNKEGFLIDFDYAQADVAMRDLAQFFVKALKGHQWDTKVALLVLSAYKQENPILRGDLGAMLAFLRFPRALWSFAERVTELYSQEDVNVLTTKVEKSLGMQASIDRLSQLLGY